MWEMVGAGLISSGILLFVLAALGAMTWGRINDRFETISKGMCEVKDCLEELYNRMRKVETDITVLQKGGKP